MFEVCEIEFCTYRLVGFGIKMCVLKGLIFFFILIKLNMRMHTMFRDRRQRILLRVRDGLRLRTIIITKINLTPIRDLTIVCCRHVCASRKRRNHYKTQWILFIRAARFYRERYCDCTLTSSSTSRPNDGTHYTFSPFVTCADCTWCNTYIVSVFASAQSRRPGVIRFVYLLLFLSPRPSATIS